MIDLEEQLEQWRKRLTSMQVMRSSDIEELEQHVRDSIATLTSIGLNAEEAFVIATYRVGAPGPVGREFAKVNGSHVWSQRVFWMAVGVLGYVVCGLVIGAIASLSQVIVLLAGGKGTAVGYTAVGITCVGWIAVAASLYRRRNEHSRRPRFTRLSAGVIGSFLAFAVVVATLMKFGSQWVLARLMPMSELGQAMMISTAATAMSTVLMPLVLLIMMLMIGRHMQETRAVDQ
jgi:hypothetical protein